MCVFNVRISDPVQDSYPTRECLLAQRVLVSRKREVADEVAYRIKALL